MTDTLTQDTTKEAIWMAVVALSSNCDGAREQDGVGFNGTDAPFGNRAAEMASSQWSDALTYEAYTMLAKYGKQLEDYGYVYAELPVPKKVLGDGRDDARQAERKRKSADSRVIDKIVDGHFVITSTYDTALVAQLRKITGAHWVPDAQKWFAPVEQGAKVRTFVETNGFRTSPEVQAQLDKFEVVSAEELTRVKRDLRFEGGTFVMDFDYDPYLVEAVKDLAGRRWDTKRKVWTLPAVMAQSVVALAVNFDFDFDPTIQAQAIEMNSQAERRAVASEADTSTLHIPGMGDKHPLTGEKLALHPFQVAGVAYAVDTKRCFIADEMGLGKSVQSLASVQHENAYPLLIVCPATLKHNWEREVRMWLPGKTVHIVDNKVGVKNSDVVIINYDILDKQKEALNAVGFQSLVFDESHYAKNAAAKRTKALKEIAEGIPVMVLALTGTPVLNRPVELVSQLEILGRIEDFGGPWNFKKRYCNAQRNGYGWDFNGASNTEELNALLRRTCYVRRQKEDVMKELPPKAKYTIETDLSTAKAKEYRAMESDTIVWLAEEGRNSEYADALAKIMILKRLAGEGKIDAAMEWIDTFLDSTSRKLVVFAHHKAVVNALADKYGGMRVAGADSMKARQEVIDKFQSDDDARVIVLNMKAGGVGITLTAASDVLFVEQGWTPAEHDQATDRCHRIGQDASVVSSWYLLADGTIDDDIFELIEAKRIVVDAVTDGEDDLAVSVMNGLIDKLVKRAND
jgi:hypothetical protein